MTDPESISNTFDNLQKDNSGAGWAPSELSTGCCAAPPNNKERTAMKGVHRNPNRQKSAGGVLLSAFEGE
jgi:hypothetical protein